MKAAPTYIFATAVLLIAANTGCRRRPGPDMNPPDYLKEHIGAFNRTGDIREYDRENLWQYNDGAAEIFLARGFTKIAVVDYAGTHGELTTEIYLFSAASGADNIYAPYLTGHEKRVDIGDKGIIAPGQLIFQQGPLLVMINYFSDIPDTIIEEFADALHVEMSK